MTCSIDYLEDKILNNTILNDSFDDFISSYIDILSYGDDEQEKNKDIRLIVRSASTPVVHSILTRSKDLKSLGVNIKVIFTQLSPFASTERWIEEICECDAEVIQSSIRWAKKQALHDAHEQLIMGNRMYWCGDSMKRALESRSITSLFEKNCAESVKLAIQAFSAMWNCSTSVTRKGIERLSMNQADAKLRPQMHDHVLESWASSFHHIITTKH